MIGIVLRAAGLAGIYLLVLTSLHPGDLLIGGAIGLALAVAFRPRRRAHPPASALRRVRAALIGAAETGREMILGTWRTVRFCLGDPAAPGFVEIPAGDRSRQSLALWGVLTGEAPDEVPVHVDQARDVLVVHLVDAADPDAVRARHARSFERWQRHVVP